MNTTLLLKKLAEQFPAGAQNRRELTPEENLLISTALVSIGNSLDNHNPDDNDAFREELEAIMDSPLLRLLAIIGLGFTLPTIQE